MLGDDILLVLPHPERERGKKKALTSQGRGGGWQGPRREPRAAVAASSAASAVAVAAPRRILLAELATLRGITPLLGVPAERPSGKARRPRVWGCYVLTPRRFELKGRSPI